MHRGSAPGPCPQAAIANKIDVMEVTFCNSVSVAEHVVMMILSLVRNYIPSYMQVRVCGFVCRGFILTVLVRCMGGTLCVCLYVGRL